MTTNLKNAVSQSYAQNCVRRQQRYKLTIAIVGLRMLFYHKPDVALARVMSKIAGSFPIAVSNFNMKNP